MRKAENERRRLRKAEKGCEELRNAEYKVRKVEKSWVNAGEG